MRLKSFLYSLLGITVSIGILCISVHAVLAEQISGYAHVSDGDTLIINNSLIRLHGIDAPEICQKCQRGSGPEAELESCGIGSTIALRDKINSDLVTCDILNKDKHGRDVGRCSTKDGDLQAWMVEQGFAVAYRKYSLDYVSEENIAREYESGLWATSFSWPWAWRLENKHLK